MDGFGLVTNMRNLLDIVKEEFQFVECRNYQLRYRSKTGYEVVVPFSDIGVDGSLQATEKGVTLMRWIRKQEEERAKGTELYKRF